MGYGGSEATLGLLHAVVRELLADPDAPDGETCRAALARILRALPRAEGRSGVVARAPVLDEALELARALRRVAIDAVADAERGSRAGRGSNALALAMRALPEPARALARDGASEVEAVMRELVASYARRLRASSAPPAAWRASETSSLEVG